ncbi:hypothetical protein COV24_03640 [candidate division WWE3 bacterium CG10_big_fil_rev_8_21_14_0_10_32_10]|uniref:Uncharacterized protein n=1 Tax=candidate division WWE3 bacterium CG10_big_fil_rev_8_21_14_0_10_32_10 TaxID=1975090 RepID=A0A2H0R9R9_UNCKA|nr:MAG: hypothetical protein COV24_03640 [candidate division WWE3 bacterium CG10_big_fil_rev_8_21_14_0_10_32_10]
MFLSYLPYIYFWSFLLLLLFITLFVFTFLYIWYKSKESFKKAYENAKDLVFFKISVPEKTEVEVKSMEQFYTNLLGVKDMASFGVNNSPSISLEIVGNSSGIDFYIVCPNSVESLVEKAVHAVYSDAEILKGKEYLWNIWDVDGFQEFSEHYLSKDSYYPLNTYEELELDSLNSITSVMSKMGTGEALALQVLIRPSSDSWQSSGNSMAHYLTNKKDKDGNITATDKDREKAEIIKSKTKKEGFDSVIRLFSVAPNKETAKSNLKNLKNAISVLANPLGNKFGTRKIRNAKQFVFAFIYRIFPFFHIELPLIKKIVYKAYSVLNTKELATLYHFPNENVKTPGINWLRSRSNIAPSDLPENGLYIGVSDFRGTETKVYMKDDDRRRHMYVIGQTGTGKSEFLKFMALQDIKAGKGIAFMDPHGSAVQDILMQIPPERVDDVIYFNPGDEQFPMGLNLLDVKTSRAQDLVINSFIELLYKLYDPNKQGIVGPQLERAVRNSMLTIMDTVPGGTLVEVLRLVIDEKYQKTLIEKIKDPVVKRYWTDEMANTQAFHKSEKTGYFVSKFDRFVTEKVMRNIIGQSKSAFDFGEVMQQKKILLIDLNKGVLGEENSKFLGLLLVPRILAAAFRRASEQGDFDDFYLYVDEFQNFSTPDFVTILSEARKYKLNLTVANQFLSQMSDDIKNAIFGNVGTLVSFRVGQDDAKYMGEQFAPHFSETDLINLKVGKTILRLLVDGHPTPPFTMNTDWDLMQNSNRDSDVAHQIIENSRNKYGRPLAEVEKQIEERSGLSKFEEPNKFPFSPPFSGGFSGGGFPSRNLPGFAPVKPQDASFSSGKTPFSQGQNVPFAPPSFSRNSFLGGNNTPGAFSSSNIGKSFAERVDSKPLGFGNTPFNNAFSSGNTRPFNPNEARAGDTHQTNLKKGAISLADLHLDKNKKVEYKESENTFNNINKTPPPRPAMNPKIIEGEEHKPKQKPVENPHNPKDSLVID